MELKNSQPFDADMKKLVGLLLHKIWIIILLGILGAGGTLAVNQFLLNPVYTSTAKVYVINREQDNKMTLSDLQTGTQLTKDYQILVKSRPVTEQVIHDLNLSMTYEQLAECILINTPQDTRIIEITVEQNNPELAKKIADSIAEISAEQMVRVMEIEKVNIIEQGNLSTLPARPNVILNTVLGGLICAFLAAIIIIILFTLDDVIHSSEDIERYLGITTLSLIPVEEEIIKNKHFKKYKKLKEKLAG